MSEVMIPIYMAAIAQVEENIEEVEARLIDRTGIKYTRSMALLGHYYGVMAWCYRRIHRARLEAYGPQIAAA